MAACGGAQPGAAPAQAPHAPAATQDPPAQHGHAGHGGHSGSEEHAYRHTGEGVRHNFSDVQRFEGMFDHPDRDRWQRPADVLRLLALAPGLTVVDLGAGTGYFLPHLAPAVQPGGQAIGLDVEPAMVAHMRERIAREELAGATARRVDPDDPGLAAGAVDRVLVVNTWHHLGDRVAYARKLRQALRPGGLVLVVDFTMDTDKGPPPSARLAPEQVLRELRAAGFAAELVAEELPDQYVVRATPG